LRRWGTLANQRGDERDHALVRRFTLLVSDGLDAGQTFMSTGDTVVVGSHAGCDLVLRDPGVSSFHCEIVPRGRSVVLRDLESETGTLLDSVAVEQAYLKSGAILTLGRTHLRFDAGGEPVRVPLSVRDRFGLLVGGSTAMRRLYAQLERVAA